jgi:hypothetical protein
MALKKRADAATKHERMVIEAAYQVLSDDAEKMGFTYSGFALTSLPHKPQTELVWKRDGHNLTMLVESGRDRAGNPLGLPYGSYARFILLFLQSEAIRTQSRDIELGRSMRVWLGSMGLSIGGTTYKLVNEQARRISGCSLTFFADRSGAQIKSRGGFVKTEITMSNVVGDQPALWQDRVLLDEDFYRALREHPVPVSESALRAIGPRSMVIDVYICLPIDSTLCAKTSTSVGRPYMPNSAAALVGFGGSAHTSSNALAWQLPHIRKPTSKLPSAASSYASHDLQSPKLETAHRLQIGKVPLAHPGYP